MAKGFVDISVSAQAKENELLLVTESWNSFPHDLNLLSGGTPLVLEHGDKRKQLTLAKGSGDESPFPYLELNTQTAKKLKIKDGERYLLEVNETGQTARLTRSKFSRTSVTLQIERSRAGGHRVRIGYSLLALLGMTSSVRSAVTLKRGAASLRTRLTIPNNELEKGLFLSGAAAAKLNLKAGEQYWLQASPSTGELTFGVSERDLDASQIASRSRPVSRGIAKPRRRAVRPGTRTAKKPTASRSALVSTQKPKAAGRLAFSSTQKTSSAEQLASASKRRLPAAVRFNSAALRKQSSAGHLSTAASARKPATPPLRHGVSRSRASQAVSSRRTAKTTSVWLTHSLR